LDAASAQDVLALLAKLNSEYGKTIVMVTHDPHAAAFATRIRHLEKKLLLPQVQVPSDSVPALPAAGSTP
jgi:putative ABC transport system ATP-binding protein